MKNFAHSPKHHHRPDDGASSAEKGPAPDTNDKKALYDFLQNILCCKNLKNDPLTSLDLIKSIKAPVIRQIPNHSYKGIIQTMKRKRQQ